MSNSIIKWLASDLSGNKLRALEEVRMLPDKDLIKWRSATGEHFSSHEEGEIHVFRAYVECGFRLLVHSFLPRVLEYYGVELVNLASNSIFNIGIFVYLYEAYLEIKPNLKVFRYFYRMVRQGSRWQGRESARCDSTMGRSASTFGSTRSPRGRHGRRVGST